MIEQYSLRPKILLASELSAAFESWEDAFDGLEGRDDGLDDEALLADLLAAVLLVDFAELGGLLLAALAGLTGVLKSAPLVTSAPTKLVSLMGETEDLLLADGFLDEADLEVDRLALLADAVERFLIEAGVVLALDDLGLGVPLMGLDERLAGVVVVCLAIMN